MDKKYHIYAITKSHWDREWYMNYQMTRIRLVHLIDSLFEIFDTDPNFVSFMLDGQTLPLEDYLEVKPYNRNRIEKYIKNGQLVIGPWYILPDEILITGETHIRNYLLGTHIAKSFGADKMQIGYLPDSFGHPSQMPQILNKLGMDTIMFWRGATEEVKKTEFYWRAPDGTRVLTVLMPAGYFTGAELSNNPGIVAQRLDSYINSFASLSSTDKIYLSIGGDHLEPPFYLSNVLNEANKFMKEGSVEQTTLSRFINDLQRSLPNNLDEISGELCGVHYSILLASTLSTRVYLKQENHKTARLLENYLEPMFSISAQQGNIYPRDILVRAWKYFMENQPHDSICGCSVDEVHQDMLYRYNQVSQIGTYMFDVARDFYKAVDTSKLGGNYALMVFNSSGRSRTDVIEAVVDFDPRPTTRNDYEKSDSEGNFPLHHVDNSPYAMKSLPTAVRVLDGELEIPCVLLDAKVANWLDLGYQRFPHQYNVNRCRIAFCPNDIPAMGYKTLRVEPIYEHIPTYLPDITEIENEYYIIRPCKDGTITVVDKENKRELLGINRLVDSGDCGDEYTYCPPDDDKVIEADPSSIKIEMKMYNNLVQQIQISGVLKIPDDIKERHVSRTTEVNNCEFSSVITLYKGVKRIDVKTKVNNRSKYHRLRVLFPTGILSRYSWSAGTFSVDKRLVEPQIDPSRKEIFNTHPQKDFCEANNGDYGLTIANKGLHEFEAYNENGITILAVTLLRCTGVISQRMIKTRKEMGGWAEVSPEGQCIGEFEFEYCIIPHAGTWEQAKTYLDAHNYNVPLYSIQIPVSEGGTLSPIHSLLEIDNPSMIVSAFKQCEFEDSYILRFYNSIGENVEANVKFNFAFSEIHLANLREDTIGLPNIVGSIVHMDLKPYEIATLKIVI